MGKIFQTRFDSMRMVTFAQLFALAGASAVTLSLLVGSIPVYASICQLSAITPVYPATADESSLITIDVPLYMNCSTNYSYMYMNVQVQVMPAGTSRVISSGNVERAYPGISNFTLPVSVQTPNSPGPWNLNVVVTVIQANFNSPTDSITTVPITIQIQQSGSY